MSFLIVLALVLLAVVLMGQYRMQKQLDRMEAQLIFNRQQDGKAAETILDNIVDSRVRVIDRIEERAHA